MVNAGIPTRELSERDQRVLEHVHIHRITTPQALQRLFFADESLDAVRYNYRRLRRDGLLVTGELWPHQPYYSLTLEAAAEYYADTDGGLLTQQPLVDAFAMLAFCCLGDTPRTRLSARELHRRTPELLVPKLSHDAYYLDADGDGTRFGWLKVDRGFNYKRSTDQLLRIVKRRREHGVWRRVIKADDFIVTFVTAWESKAERIQSELDSKRQPVPYGVHVVPELRHMISRSIREE